MTQTVLPFAARRDRTLDAPQAAEPTPIIRFRQGRVFTFAFSPYAGERAGKSCTLYGPTPRQAIERLVDLLARPAGELEAEPYAPGCCEVFADSPILIVPRRSVAHVEGMEAAELNDLLKLVERWAC